jgi:hypothetical protein
MVFALFLLFAAKDGLERRRTDFERLNSGRRRHGREELWEHIELRAPINVTYDHDRSQWMRAIGAARACIMHVALSRDAVTRCSGDRRTCAAVRALAWCTRAPWNYLFISGRLSYRLVPARRSSAAR